MEGAKKKITEEEAFIALSRTCARSEHCLFDMKRKMYKWEMDDDAKENVLKRLVKEDFINENRFAKAFVKDKFLFNHWGMMKIVHELRARHICEEDIEDAKGEVSEEETLEELRKLIEEKRSIVKGKSDYEIRAKLFRYAYSKGFDIDDINAVLDDLE